MIANENWRHLEGQTVLEAARVSNQDTCDFVCNLLVACDLAVGIVGFRPGDRTEADVRAIMRHPAHMAGSDGIFCGGFPHPRGWGAFARYLGLHTMLLGDFDSAQAVTHLSTHAARRFQLRDRGLLLPGFAADIAIYDPATVIDKATYANGREFAEGVAHVFVNGTPVLLDGEPTGATPGRALRRL
jgi:N-acyl-D-amino-acid deacylase